MATSHTIFAKFFSAKGRLRRKGFGIVFIILGSIQLLLTLASGNAMSIFQIFIQLVLIILIFLQMIKRCHDMGKSGWFSLIGLIPVAGILLLLLSPGVVGPNKYGNDPKIPHFNLDEKW